MAIDTENRRASMLGFGDLITFTPPDNQMLDSDRHALLGHYYGFDYAGDGSGEETQLPSRAGIFIAIGL